MHPQTKASDYVPEFEGLRGILAVWVMAYHAAVFGGLWGYVPAQLGSLLDGVRAVEVFMILSGFVIATLLWRERERYDVFVLRRLLRLYPVYLICLVVAGFELKLGIVAPRFDVASWPSHLVAHLLLLQGAVPETVLPGSAGAILNPAWSISLEWQFYLIAPALLYFSGIRGVVVASLVAVVLSRIVAPQIDGFSGAFLPLNVQFFWIGIVSCALWQAVINKGTDPWLVTLSWIGVAAGAVLFLPLTRAVPIAIWLITIGAAASVRIEHMNTSLCHVADLLNRPAVLALGRWSFPIYLAHEPVIIAVRWALPEMHPIVDTVIIIAVAGSLTVFLAALLHRWVELPFITIGKRLKRGTALAVPAYRG